MTNTINIPQELKRFQTWSCYDEGKQLISAINGYRILAGDYNSYATWDIACSYMLTHPNQVKGLAFILPKNYICVDIGSDIPQDILKEWLELPTYMEYSDTTQSIHIFLPVDFKEQIKVCPYYNIIILSSGAYVCMTGNVLYENAELSKECEHKFYELYNKYFLNKKQVSQSAYLFVKSSSNKEITSDIVKNRIKLSSASHKYYGLMNGDYLQNGFVEKNEAVIGLFNIVYFWSEGNKPITYSIVKESKLYDEKMNSDFNGSTLFDILFKKSLEIQKCFYEEDSNDEDYLFDQNRCLYIHYKRYPLDDTGNALRLYDKIGNFVKYDIKNKEFYIYDDQEGYWKVDTNEHIFIKKYVDSLIEDLTLELELGKNIENVRNLTRNISYLASSKGKANCIEEFKHLKDIPCMPQEFDADNTLLNTRSGVINLKNIQLLEHNKDFMMTKSTHCEVDLVHKPELFIQFIKETFCYDDNLISYIQRFLGYCLTGSTKEQKYSNWLGGGNNGKSVLFNVIEGVMGDYCVRTPIETFLKKKFSNGSEATPDRARLRGARVVLAEEPDDNSYLDEPFIKLCTGGGTITARKLHKEFFQFQVLFKLIISSNNPLRIVGTTRGDYRRLDIVEFNNNVPDEEIDKELTEKLLAEKPQILGWALQGCIEWQERGLEQPQSVKDTIEQYKLENNVVLDFISNYTTESSYNKVLVSDIFTAYMSWARSVNENTNISKQKFGIELKKAIPLLYPNAKKIHGAGNKIFYSGFRLLQTNKGEGYAVDIPDDLKEDLIGDIK